MPLQRYKRNAKGYQVYTTCILKCSP